MRRTIAKAVTWRLIGTAEIFGISFWTTGHLETAGHTAGIVAISSVLMYVAHELAWDRHQGGGSRIYLSLGKLRGGLPREGLGCLQQIAVESARETGRCERRAAS